MSPTITNIPATLYDSLNAHALPCILTGELSTILTFTTAPLFYTLRIIGSKASNTVRVVKARENTSNAFTITSQADVTGLIIWILEFAIEKETEAYCGQLRLVPRTDSALLRALRSDAPNLLEPFAEARTMVEQGYLLDAVVELFTPFGLQPTLSDASVSFDAKELRTNELHACPKIFRLKKYGFESDIHGGLDLSSCVTLLYARSYGATVAAVDKKRILSSMLVEAGYIDELDQDDFMPQKVLLYDLSKAEDRNALVERILLMRDSERNDKAPFEMGKWMGKQEGPRVGTRTNLCPERRPKAHAYHHRKGADRTSSLRFNILREDIEFGEKEMVVKRSRLPPAGDENLLEFVLWQEQDRVNEVLLEGKQKLESEQIPELTQYEDNEEMVEPITPPTSPSEHSFAKSWADMVDEDEEDEVELVALDDRIVV
ncbi:uncharacterized protein N0V89_008840 [Didymosphaeria variabile]|uniref:Uncharacterized protein n=1 Tax=Didymosphaeria variabile TaxID=1932322 RepID=A0A9W8XIE7_9PLEO|nr:uncharacterized protein N0V89_008840 [Didymosphaeria variabile]KAJ4350219.1 hypothetical protein N0V89_008840 [Didymosphaeria variabile]